MNRSVNLRFKLLFLIAKFIWRLDDAATLVAQSFRAVGDWFEDKATAEAPDTLIEQWRRVRGGDDWDGWGW